MQQFNKQIYACLKESPFLPEQEAASNCSRRHSSLFHAWPARRTLLLQSRQQNRRHQNLTFQTSRGDEARSAMVDDAALKTARFD